MAEVASSVAGRVVDILFGAAKKEISYMWNCSQNLKKCKNEADKLKSMEERVQHQRELAIAEGRVSVEGLDAWIKKAHDNVSDATTFINEEAGTKKTCFSFKTLHHYGKMATKRTSSLLQLQEDGKIFETCVAHPARTPGFVDLYQGKNLENINTQKKMLTQIIQAIEDDRVQIVCICGLGGVGKTTLASEVAKQMKNQFAEIVFIAISQNIDAKRIKEEVARAARRIINKEKILIILDDMWEKLKLHEVGIPCGNGYMNCKILITSRDQAVCEEMEAQKIIPVDPLQPKEAWTVFERVVGKNEWGDKLKRVAVEVVKECGGLPLFLEAVGNALKNKEIGIWEGALKRLKDATDKDLPYKRRGIMQLKLSYDQLDSPFAKSCFLLCAMFREDKAISLRDLTYYSPALGIFDNYDSNIQIEDAKSRVQLAVELLKSSSLLLDVPYEDFFKTHDLVRDMAILITSEGDNKYSVQSGKGLKEWQPGKHLESCKKISLMSNKIAKLPDHELHFPHLDTFLAQENEISFVPDEFFRGMENLKVLDMSLNNISSLPISLKKLTELHSLDLSGNSSLCEISVLGELTCLVILNLSATGIKNIPKAIGLLKNLRLLTVLLCPDLSYVTPGVISNLNRLEELYVGIKNEGDCSFVAELSELKLLKVLHLHFPNWKYFLEDMNFRGMIKADIQDESCLLPIDADNQKCKRHLRIADNSFLLKKSVRKLIQVCDTLQLADIKDLDSIMLDLYPTGSEKLRHIQLFYCENVTSLVKTSVISNKTGLMETNLKSFSQVQEKKLTYLGGFCNLRIIHIWGCHSLLELFPLSLAQGLINLKYLNLESCHSLGVIISAGDEQSDADADGGEIQQVIHDTEVVLLPQLTKIKFTWLPKLESFCSSNSIIKYPSLKRIDVFGCGSMKRWSYGENHMPNINIDHEWIHYRNINDYVAEQQQKDGWKLGEDFFSGDYF